jgi:predicted  nucleic acid-binding Zn-ribbon protein
MSLANEAGYLYVLSKELSSINTKLRTLSKKAEKHQYRHHNTRNESKKEKHKVKHARVTIQIHDLMKKHTKLVTRLKHHEAAFRHALHKEHKI